MALSAVIALLIIAISLVYFWIRKKFAFFEENGFLNEKPTFPFGNLKGVGTEFHIVYKIKELYEKFKGKAPAFGIFFSVNAAVVITDLETVKNVLVKEFDTFHNRGIYYNLEDDPLTGQLFTLDDDAWKSMRHKLTPTFTSGKMKMMFQTLVNIADIMVTQLKKEPNLEMVEAKEVLANYTTDVIGNVAFGLEMNSIQDPDAKFRKMGRKIFSQGKFFQLKIFFMTSFKNLARKLHMLFIPKDVSEFFLGSITETVNYRLKNDIHRNDVMDLLLKTNDENGSGKLTLNEIAAQCFSFFAAGFETSSSTSSFVLYNLCLNQNIQDKLRNEINLVLAKYNGEITYEAVQEMKYLQMVIDETLRMYSPVFQLIRTATRDFKIPNTDLTIFKGTLTVIPIHAIHNDPDVFPNPEVFDPERFSDENKKNRHSMAFIPFGDGPRNCIGMRFGLMQTKVGLIKLLTSFKFSPSSRTTIPMTFNSKSLTLSPINDMWLKVEKI